MPPELGQPWRAFFDDIDGLLTEPLTLPCLGGFVITAWYGMPRPTADVDVLAVAPGDTIARLVAIGGKASTLHKKHGLYVDVVTVAECPDGYEARLTQIDPGAWRQLRVLALDPYDLALAKLQRNLQRDRDDVVYSLGRHTSTWTCFRGRYVEELRPYLGRPEREDLTLELWIEMINETRARRRCPRARFATQPRGGAAGPWRDARTRECGCDGAGRSDVAAPRRDQARRRASAQPRRSR
jgi:hypothetical protein